MKTPVVEYGDDQTNSEKLSKVIQVKVHPSVNHGFLNVPCTSESPM